MKENVQVENFPKISEKVIKDLLLTMVCGGLAYIGDKKIEA